MIREVTKKLVEWKAGSNRKPLLVRGARQVGKTYSIVEFGKKYFEGTLHIINFEKQPDWHNIFEQNYDILRIISELEILIGKRIIPGRDLLFFDEIQACPKAIVSLRYFFEQVPELHVIAAGSLLEFALKDIPFPVGRVQIITMHPMNFYEFLQATGKTTAAEVLKSEPRELPISIDSLLREELRKYFIIGGMPECVGSFCQEHSFHRVYELQTDLIETFRQDFSKYAVYSNKQCLNAVLSSLPQCVGNQVKYSAAAEGFSIPTIKNAFALLETARLFKKVRASSPEGLPLNASASEKKFKIIMVDIGILSRLSGISVSAEFQKTDLLSLFRGVLAEQFVGQELIASGHEDLFYWSREAKSSSAETDFLIQRNNSIIPIEVKSGSSGRLKSLHILLDTYPNVKDAFIFTDNNFGRIPEQKLSFFPLYYVSAAAGINYT